ncbi:hypothetical protein CFBP498_49860 (plasmid) [Xanthomonas hortorum pv. vitians]|uniref:Transmembrane protein n=1 Tax=Xanthomonas hortorum pv. vitians TaxID=83224 RepID=A0A6V7FJW6_9XANT|nr:hypothetical protein CFBP498_49860 [Xanthomonas hortorum pv. vitians]CAD0363952.1 hypothetical protein CFBP498_49860 [Xanthomonas hortorum pv. vitians]
MLRYLPLVLYPVLPAIAGAFFATSPRWLCGSLVVLLFALYAGGKRNFARSLVLLRLPARFAGAAAALCVTCLFTQAIAAFLLGIGLVAGWQVGWLLPYALMPSVLLSFGMAARRSLRR